MWPILLLALAGSGAQGRDMALEELITVLQSQGYRILYSSSLVQPDQRVSVATVNLESLERELNRLGLALESRDGVWVIVRGAPPLNPPVTPESVSAPLPLETVVVTGSLHRLAYTGLTASAFSFSAEDLTLVPTLGSDAMRATLRLPGVSSVGVSAKPRIRGGLQDELLVMQDGVELLEPFHLADYHSAYSSLDYHTIESVDVYTGGFPSRYGNRMSGVMEIGNQWQEGDYNTDIGVSSFASFIHTRGEFSAQKPGRWLLSYRQGDLSELTGYIDSRSGEPRYKDFSARLGSSWSEALDLSAGVVYAEDDVEFLDEEESASSRIDNLYTWLGADWLVSRSLGARFTLSWLDFERHKQQASFEEDEEDPGKGGFLDHRQEVQRLALRNDWSRISDNTHWEFGWQLEHNDASYRHQSLIDRGELAEILGTEGEVERAIVAQPEGWSGGSYVQLEWDLTARFTLQPSLRWDWQNYYLHSSSQQELSPRLGMAYWWSDATLLRLSMGRFVQQEGIQELQVLDGVTHFFRPQRSDQVVAGIQWQNPRINLMAELYYKHYDNPKGRYENIFNPFVLLPEMEPDRVALAPDRARARGMDLDGKFQLNDSLTGFLRYSYMDATDRINGNWVDRRWSQRHTVNSGLIWQGDSFSLSLALSWHSGWRSSEVPAFVAEDTVLPLEAVLNNTELDDYFSLDVGARKFWEWPRARVEIYADFINVTDHRNLAGIDYDIEEVDGGYTLTPDNETLLRHVPSVGITLSF
jgi:TonB dependent receptor-like, beta-barrel/TonB-dependent Receptor Plug Domain